MEETPYQNYFIYAPKQHWEETGCGFVDACREGLPAVRKLNINNLAHLTAEHLSRAIDVATQNKDSDLLEWILKTYDLPDDVVSETQWLLHENYWAGGAQLVMKFYPQE